MAIKAKYSNDIVWDINSFSNNNSFNNTIKNKNKNNENSFKKKYNVNIDYSINYKYKKINPKNKKNNKDTNTKNNFAGVYYGFLLFFLLGFLFFLSISIGFASARKNVSEKYDYSQLYNQEESEKLLENFIYKNDISEVSSEIYNIENKSKKIEFFKYTVKRNDNYKKIADKFNLKIDTILLVNNISTNNILKIGTILKIPNQDGRVIIVKKNDSIHKIANRYGIKWESLADINDIKSSVIHPGSRLFVPGSAMSEYERKQFYGEYYLWPLIGKITSGYGTRVDPFTGALSFHSGIDIKGKTGAQIKCTRDGKVTYTGWNKIYGNFIMVRHDKSTISLYAHLSEMLVKKGQYLKQGQCLGKVGSTGRSTGPHLHFEVRKNGKITNPMKYLK